jgi:hypothetical protein
MKRILFAAVAALALGGSALAYDIGPPPPPPPKPNCAAGLLWGRYAGNYINGCLQGYQVRLQRWQADMAYWQAMQGYQGQGGQQ